MNWKIQGQLQKKSPADRQQELLNLLLKNRGLKTPQQKKDFFQPPSPLTLTLKELKISSLEVKKAINRVTQAIKNKEKIIIYGDYDADGICGTAVLWEILDFLGAQVLPLIPDRVKEGYGLNLETIKKLKKENPNLQLIITVDQGITAHQKIEFAQKEGIDVIITDHHQPQKENPPAFAIVHTTLLSGTGVAWVLARELAQAARQGKRKILSHLELVALGTITDLLPLTGPNRCLTTFGLKELNQTQRIGLKSLFRQAGIEKGSLGTYEIGFLIGPRLNATGRLTHALDSLRLLCTRNRQRAFQLAQRLNRLNQDRQKLLEQTTLQAREAWLSQKVKGTKLIFVDGQGWEEGVIGLTASRLANEFYLPVIVINRGSKHSKASARSIDGFDIINAIREAENLLVDAGGHPMAAGFTVETKKINQVKEKLIAIAEERIDSRILEKSLQIDCQVNFEDLKPSLFNQIERFAPFGVGNPRPDFVTRQTEIVSLRLVGKESQHLKLTLRSPQTGLSFPAIGFGLGEYYFKLSPGKKIDLAYNLIADAWGGEKKLQLRIKDIKL